MLHGRGHLNVAAGARARWLTGPGDINRETNGARSEEGHSCLKRERVQASRGFYASLSAEGLKLSRGRTCRRRHEFVPNYSNLFATLASIPATNAA